MDAVLLCWTAPGGSGLAASIIVREYSEKWITDFSSIQESGMPRMAHVLQNEILGSPGAEETQVSV